MADTFYPTGISTTPIDFTSGATAFMKSAVEARLGEIASSQEQISGNAKNVMKAMSVQAAPELYRAQQDRYNKEIEDYRNKVRDVWKERGGKLTQDDRIMIQRGEEDLRNRMQSELNDLKTFQSYQERIYDPNFQYAYNPQQYQQILGSAYDRIMKGEGIGNIAAEASQAMLQPTTGDYTSKRYGNEIKRLSEQMVGEFKGNIFTSTQSQDKGQAERLLNTIMQDPNIRSRYTANDGTVLEEERANVEQELRDYINQTIKQTKPYRQTTGSGKSDYEPYSSTIADSITLKDKTVPYEGYISTTEITPFPYNGTKVISEGIFWTPDGKGGLHPVVKLQVPNDKSKPATTLEEYYEQKQNYHTEIVPLDTKNLKGALLSKATTKRSGFEKAIKDMEEKMKGVKPRTSSGWTPKVK